jgi:two-component system sensor histidine kinase YesM
MNDKIVNLIEENYVTKIKEKDAQLMALNFQVNPHFLYNTLNTINCIALENGQKEISKMLVSLSELLRHTVKNSKKTVMFCQEFEYLKNYIFIMMNRFEGRFVFETEIPPEIQDIRVPNFFLQPFVENSVIHGFEDMEKGGIIKVSARFEEDTVVFLVEDNGKGIGAEELRALTGEDGKSVGISNVDNRIKLLFGRRYGVRIESGEGGTRVFITIPKSPDSEENPPI